MLLNFHTLGMSLLCTLHMGGVGMSGSLLPNRISMSKATPRAWWLPNKVAGKPNGRYHALVMASAKSLVPRHTLIVSWPWLWVAGVGWDGYLWQCRSMSGVLPNRSPIPWSGDRLPVFSLRSMQISISWLVSIHVCICVIRLISTCCCSFGFGLPCHNSIWYCWVYAVLEPMIACCGLTLYMEALMSLLWFFLRSSI